MKRVKQSEKKAENATKTEQKRTPLISNSNTAGNLFDKYFNKFSIPILVFLLLIIGFVAFNDFIFAKYLFFFKGIGSDTINQDLPQLIHRSENLGNSYFQQWSFYQGMGNTFIMSIPVEPLGLFSYLFHYVGDMIWGTDFFIYGRFHTLFIFHFLFSGIFFFLYLRTISVGKYTSVIGALFVSFSGFMVMASSWGLSGLVFVIVFLLFAFEQLMLKKRWYFFPLAVVYASGNFFSLYIYSLFLLTYSIFRYFSFTDNKIKGYFKLAAKMIGLGIAGLLMNSINSLRVLLVMFFSPRVAGNSSLAEELVSGNTGIDYSTHASTAVLRLFSNDILGSGIDFKGWYNYFEAPAFYIGIFSLIVFSQIFTTLKNRERLLFILFSLFWIVPVFFPDLRYAILAYTGDYYRFGFDFIIPFIILFAAVFSLNKIESGFKINYYTLLGSAILLFVLLYFPYKSVNQNFIDTDIRKVISLLIIFYTAIVFLFSIEKYRNTAKILLMLIVVFELSFSSKNSYDQREPLSAKEYEQNMGGYKDGTFSALKIIKKQDPAKFYRTTKDYQSGNAMHGSLNDAMVQGYYGTTRYSSFTQINYIRFLEETGIIPKGDETSTRWVTGLRGYPLLQSFASVKYQLSKTENPEFLRFGFSVINKTDKVTILKNEYYLPFGFSYNKYIDFDEFVKLRKYEISPYSLKNIETELQRFLPSNKIDLLLSSVQPIVNQQFESDSAFYAGLQNLLSQEDFAAHKTVFIRHSTQNFKNQIALLTCFVNEYDENRVDTSGFEHLNISDTSIFVEGNYFNFEKYKELISELRKDTFKIEKFNQSYISGSINMTQRKLLFFTIPFDNGWEITVNGQKRELKMVNLGFSGIDLDAGSYNIELEYKTEFYDISLYVTIISNILFWSLLFFYLIKRKKKNAAGE